MRSGRAQKTVCPSDPKTTPYVQFDRAAATWLSQLIERRYERYSTIITSNKSFGDWSDILGDTTMAGALPDQLLHHRYVLNLKPVKAKFRT